VEAVPLLVLLGPTAVGKTAVGIALAKHLDAEIVSVDSRQIYREMDIGTAKPTPEERRAVPHHLLDVVFPDEPFAAADFQRLADAAIADIRRRGKVPLLVGGAGLYFRALVDGLFEGPPADPQIRARLNALADEEGNAALHARLAAVDPEAAARIHPNDRMRLVRALEVYEQTGTPISRLQTQWTPSSPRHPFIAFCLRRPRDELNRRANARVKQMLQQGLLDEVRRLRERYPPHLKAFRGFGYRELWDFLDGKHSYEKAIELLKRHTHQYAKRQMTWFRADRRLVGLDLAPDESPDAVAERILRTLPFPNR